MVIFGKVKIGNFEQIAKIYVKLLNMTNMGQKPTLDDTYIFKKKG